MLMVVWVATALHRYYSLVKSLEEQVKIVPGLTETIHAAGLVPLYVAFHVVLQLLTSQQHDDPLDDG